MTWTDKGFTKPQVVLFMLEPLENRYTGSWWSHLPKKTQEAGFDVMVIAGAPTSTKTTPGAFLNFSKTNQWKNEQFDSFMQKVETGSIRDEAILFFADAWNPVILEIAYIRDLMGKKWKLASMWHAGSYDPQDLLGQKAKKDWSRAAEFAFYNACDVNFFATNFHLQLFLCSFPTANIDKSFVCGFPFEYIEEIPFEAVKKEKIVLFPHRHSSEKNYPMFEALKDYFRFKMPDWKFEAPLCASRPEYENWLARSSIVWSGSFQETLGISMFEGLCAACLISVPNRLSYCEMYGSELKSGRANYFQDYKDHLEFLMEKSDDLAWKQALIEREIRAVRPFFTGDQMFEKLRRVADGF